MLNNLISITSKHHCKIHLAQNSIIFTIKYSLNTNLKIYINNEKFNLTQPRVLLFLNLFVFIFFSELDPLLFFFL